MANRDGDDDFLLLGNGHVSSNQIGVEYARLLNTRPQAFFSGKETDILDEAAAIKER
jgi:hypothetical protein